MPIGAGSQLPSEKSQPSGSVYLDLKKPEGSVSKFDKATTCDDFTPDQITDILGKSPDLVDGTDTLDKSPSLHRRYLP